MNLARVEHYLSDFLSCMETRKHDADRARIEQESLVLHEQGTLTVQVAEPNGTTVEVKVPPRLRIPTNLYITGTVNVDETTYSFSPKVLDRAHVIEFDHVNLDEFRALGGGEAPAAAPAGGATVPTTWPGFQLSSAENYHSLSPELHTRLKAINAILEPAHFHLGYRSMAEIAHFTKRLAEVATGASESDLLDAAVLQKVLPRLHGNRARLELPLLRLIHLFQTGADAPDLAPDVELDVEAGTLDGIGAAQAACPQSRQRLAEMISTLRDFGFVAFFK